MLCISYRPLRETFYISPFKPNIANFTERNREQQPSHKNWHCLLFNFLGFPPAFTCDSCCCCCCCRFSISCPTAVLTASSKTSSTPDISLLLHSTYTAPIRFATAWPCSGVTGVNPWVLRRSIQERLQRRSDLSPTRISGVVGQKWRTSGYH